MDTVIVGWLCSFFFDPTKKFFDPTKAFFFQKKGKENVHNVSL